MATTAPRLTGGSAQLSRPTPGASTDRLLKWSLVGVAGLILLLIIAFLVTLVAQSGSAFSRFGASFIFGNNWDVPTSIFRSLPMLVGTLITSGIALILGVPVAVASALYITELCPRRLRGPLGILIDLLAAVPSVVYGLWAVFFLAPTLLGPEQWFARTFSFIPWIGGDAAGAIAHNYFLAGLILAIMIVPIMSAISREVIATVPAEHKEASLALGATRWEMIRMAVLPYSRSGIVGGAMLGLGRALGETIAVVLVIGDNPSIGKHLFAEGYTYASVIANEFGEATGLHRSALFAAGLVLFVLTLIVNVLARAWVGRGERRLRGDRAGAAPLPGGAPGIATAAVEGV